MKESVCVFEREEEEKIEIERERERERESVDNLLSADYDRIF